MSKSRDWVRRTPFEIEETDYWAKRVSNWRSAQITERWRLMYWKGNRHNSHHKSNVKWTNRKTRRWTPSYWEEGEPVPKFRLDYED